MPMGKVNHVMGTPSRSYIPIRAGGLAVATASTTLLLPNATVGVNVANHVGAVGVAHHHVAPAVAARPRAGGGDPVHDDPDQRRRWAVMSTGSLKFSLTGPPAPASSR